MLKAMFSALALFTGLTTLRAEPLISSWFTDNSGLYARVYTNTADEIARNAVTTWSRGAGVQTQPVYAGVHQILFSSNWVYVRTSGLGSHLMGPWYLNEAKTQLFGNLPANTAKLFRLPRVPVYSTNGGLTGLGAAGYMVNGVALFDMRDAFSYSTANATDATPVNGITGDGIWNRNAYHNESVTFDPAYAHQAGATYHYHAQPIALRHQLGDHVTYQSISNRYTESTAPVTDHSPILAWAWDGFPVYGPYGYSNALDAASPVRRMISGFVLRNGTNGTTSLAVTGRTTLPAWAARVAGRASTTLASTNYGPAVGTNYLIGHYLEDYAYLGDLGYTQGVQFDLDESNARYCVTPEFPGGTWAYFTTIAADGTPAFPYTTGRRYRGTTQGGEVTTISEAVRTNFNGGPNTALAVADAARNATNGDFTLVWSSVQGGTYQVEVSPSLSVWSNLGSTVTATGVTTSATESRAAQGALGRRFYRVRFTSLAAYQTNGFVNLSAVVTNSGGGTFNTVAPGGTATAGTTNIVLITLPTTPPLPPNNFTPTNVTLAATLIGTSVSRLSSNTVQATFVIPGGTNFIGLKPVVVAFSPAPTYTIANGVTIVP